MLSWCKQVSKELGADGQGNKVDNCIRMLSSNIIKLFKLGVPL